LVYAFVDYLKQMKRRFGKVVVPYSCRTRVSTVKEGAGYLPEKHDIRIIYTCIYLPRGTPEFNAVFVVVIVAEEEYVIETGKI